MRKQWKFHNALERKFRIVNRAGKRHNRTSPTLYTAGAGAFCFLSVDWGRSR